MTDRQSTWRPLRRRHADPWDADPRPIRASLDQWAARIGTAGTDALGTVFGRWEDTVGPGVAQHARPIALTRGTLVVAVDDPAWATQLRFLGSTILESLQTAVGPGVVEHIEVRVRRS